MRKIIFPLLIGLLAVVFSGAVACKPAPALDVEAIRAYADPAAETTLQGLSEDNLAKYTEYGNPQFKAAVDQAKLDQVAAQISAQLGAYVSKEYLSVEQVQGYIVVHYRATYEKGQAGIRMVFDQDHRVAGQFFE